MRQISNIQRRFSFNLLPLFLFGFICFSIPGLGQVVPVGSADWGHLRPLVVSNEVVLCTVINEINQEVLGDLYLATFSAEITDTLHSGAYSLLTHEGEHFIAMNGMIYRYSQGELEPQSTLLPHPVHTLIAPPKGLSDVAFIGLADEAIVLGMPGLAQVIETPFSPVEVDSDGLELYVIGEMSALLISLDNDEILETITFPGDHTLIYGSSTGGIILLREDYPLDDHLRRFKRLDLHTGNLNSLIDSSGNEQLLPLNMEKAQATEDIVYLMGTGPGPHSEYSGIYGMYAARVHMQAGVVELAEVFSEVSANTRLQPQVAMASSGAVVFGCFSRNGTEPHVFRDGKLKVLRDIYPGFGSSISLRQKPYSRGNSIFFTAIHSSGGHSLWRTDGTPESTIPIALLPNMHFAPEFVIFPETEGPLGHILVMDEDGRKLYSFDPLSSEIALPVPAEDEWEVAYNATGMGNSFSAASHTSGPSIGIADDASVAILNKGLPTMLDYAAQNSLHAWQRKLLIFYRTGYIHVHDSTGVLTGTFRFDQNNSSYACMARDAATGKMIVAVKHRGNTTYLDDVPYESDSDGYFLVGLTSDATIEFINFFPAGDLFIIEAMKYIGSEVFVAGAFVGSIGLNGVDITGKDPTRWHAFAARYDVIIQNFTWINKLPLPQSSWTGGAFYLETDLAQKAVYVVAGGSSPAENLNCSRISSHVQIARFDATSGYFQWNNVLRSGGGIRPAGFIKLSNGAIFCTGVAYDDLEIEGLNLKKTTVAFAGCSTQRFLMGLNAADGAVLTLKNTDTGTGALPQAMLPAGEGFSILSFAPGEEVTQYGNNTWSALMDLEASVYSPSGRHLKTQLFPTGLNVGSRREEFIAQSPLSAALHGDDGLILAAHNMDHGTLKGRTFQPVAQNFDGGYILIQRRKIDFGQDGPDQFHMGDGDGLVIFPNPVDRSAVIILPLGDTDTYHRLSLYDISGRRIQSFATEPAAREFLVDVSALVPGVYIIRVEGEEIRSGKLVVHR